MKLIARTIVDFLDNSCKLFPDKTALLFEKEQYTYRQLKEESEKLADFLTKRIRKGEIVGLLLSNRPHFIISYFAIFKAGGVVLLLEQGISDDNLINRVTKTNTHILISETKYRDKFLRCKFNDRVKFINVDELKLAPVGFKNVKVSTNDVSTIIYTSGTTSEPKGARLRHYNVVAATNNIVNYLNFVKNDIDVNISSLSHSFGLGHIHCTFTSGATTVLFRNSINIGDILSTIVTCRATTFAATPAFLRLMTAHFRGELKRCGKYLRLIQTNISPLEPELVKDILELLPNTKFCYYYGLSEASRATFLTFNKNLKKLLSVGKPMPNVKIKIVDSRGRKQPTGIPGEIAIKGKIVIKDYFKNAQANRRIKNGWFYTGDWGYLDRNGYLFFQSRRDDIINVSGEKVFPEEVEGCIRSIPGVLDAAVIGIPDKFLGEVVKAYIKVKKTKFDTNSVLKICREKLESYKIPRAIEVVGEIPRTDNGKLRRNLLRNHQ